MFLSFWFHVESSLVTAQLLKANGAVDVIAENGLAGVDIAGKEALDAFPQKLRPKIRVSSMRARRVCLKSRVNGIVSAGRYASGPGFFL
jgi:hypothetical protein